MEVHDGRGDDVVANDAPPIAVTLVPGNDGAFLVALGNQLKN